jgi:MoxR-like ATPase
MTETTRFSGTKSYLTNEALEAAVNCALVLQKPLLVRGEPGTGKTLLAEAVSEALDAPLLTWHVKSTTRAQEGLYASATATCATSASTSGSARWATRSSRSSAWCC